MTRRKVVVMKPTSIREADLYGLPYPVDVQPKLDGVRAQAICPRSIGEPWILRSSTGLVFKSLRTIPYELADYHLPGGFFDGELIHPNGFRYASGIARRLEYTPEESDLKLVIFDVVNPYNPPWKSRRETLDILRAKDVVQEHIEFLFTDTAYSPDEVMQFYRDFLAAGYEGIIIRLHSNVYIPQRSKTIFKMKPTQTLEATIIGFEWEVDKNGVQKDYYGVILCKTDEGVEFGVGSGLTDADKLYITANAERLVGKTVIVKYQELMESGKPRFPVFKGLKE